MIIGIDFDGTCVTHEFPKIGRPIGSERVLKALVEKGHKIILFTMRSDIQNAKGNGDEIGDNSGNFLTEAVEWFKERNIPLFGINENPEQHTWTTSPKPYCHVYIDDAALGCPLVYSEERPYVDWGKVENELIKLGAL